MSTDTRTIKFEYLIPNVKLRANPAHIKLRLTLADIHKMQLDIDQFLLNHCADIMMNRDEWIWLVAISKQIEKKIVRQDTWYYDLDWNEIYEWDIVCFNTKNKSNDKDYVSFFEWWFWLTESDYFLCRFDEIDDDKLNVSVTGNVYDNWY